MFRSLFKQSTPPQNDRARRRVRLGLECLESREVPAGVFTVTTTSDVPVANKLTLRQAITQANVATAAGDKEAQYINFSSLPANDWTIKIGSPLPPIESIVNS